MGLEVNNNSDEHVELYKDKHDIRNCAVCRLLLIVYYCATIVHYSERVTTQRVKKHMNNSTNIEKDYTQNTNIVHSKYDSSKNYENVDNNNSIKKIAEINYDIFRLKYDEVYREYKIQILIYRGN